MIAKQYRFQGQNGLTYVYRRGTSIRTKYLSAKYIRNTRRDSWRVSVVVSKKTAKAAPIRNRIRRRLYEQIRHIAPQYLENHDVVITVYDAQVAVIDTTELVQIVCRVLRTIHTETKKLQSH